MECNTFRHIDALEYAKAWDACESFTSEEIEKMAQALSVRMRAVEKGGGSIPSYLLAAYRGYESALILRTNPDAFCQFEPFVVTLNDAK